MGYCKAAYITLTYLLHEQTTTVHGACYSAKHQMITPDNITYHISSVALLYLVK